MRVFTDLFVTDILVFVFVCVLFGGQGMVAFLFFKFNTSPLAYANLFLIHDANERRMEQESICQLCFERPLYPDSISG